MGTFLQLSGIIRSESRENSPFIRSSCAPQTHPHRRISPNPPQESFCGFFVFWKFLQARYNFVRSFLQMGAMIDTDGGNAPDKQSGQRCGAACCRKVRRSPPRRANGGKLVCACLFLPRGSSERPRFFVCGAAPDECPGKRRGKRTEKPPGSRRFFVSEGDEQHRDGKGDDG